MKASDLFVRCLEAEGIEYIFGVPGEENADFILSLERSSRIQFVLTRHEQGAAFMAEVYGRLTGHPAGCLGTLGPGASNLVTGVADGNMDRAPMLVLTGQGSTRRLHKESHQVMDVVAMFEPVTKWAISVRHPETIPEIVRKAVRLARQEKPGAVHIELPEDLAKLETHGTPMDPRRFRRSSPNPEIIEQAADLLAAAECLVIIAGNGCIRKRASESLRRLCESTGIGVVSTFMAKGAVSLAADYCMYTVGLGARDHTNELIEQADVVLTLGFDMVEYHPSLWNAGRGKTVIHADFEPAEIDAHYHPEVEVVADLAATVDALAAHLDAKVPLPFDRAPQQRARARMQEDLEAAKDDVSVGSIRPQKAVWDARRVLGPDDLLLSDVGAHKMWIARHYHCFEPNTCLIPNGYCSMGFALPGAIAASLVQPARRVLGIAGDGGFLMNVQEMETAHRLGSNLVMMIWEDLGYGLIEWKQEDEFGRHSSLSFTNPDWLKLAESFGWTGYRCEASAELEATLEAAFQDDGPSLVVIPIDYRENPRLTEKLGRIESPEVPGL